MLSQHCWHGGFLALLWNYMILTLQKPHTFIKLWIGKISNSVNFMISDKPKSEVRSLFYSMSKWIDSNTNVKCRKNISQHQILSQKLFFNSDCYMHVYWWLRAIFSRNVNSFVEIGMILDSPKCHSMHIACLLWESMIPCRKRYYSAHKNQKALLLLLALFMLLFYICPRHNQFSWHYR